MTDLMEEVRGILRENPIDEMSTRGFASLNTGKGNKDPADVAYNLIQNHDALIKQLNKGVDEIGRSFTRASRSTQAAKRHYGGGHLHAIEIIGMGPLDSLKQLQNFVNGAVNKVEGLVRDGRRHAGKLGRTEEVDADWDSDVYDTIFESLAEEDEEVLVEGLREKLIKPSKNDSKTISALRKIVREHQHAKVSGVDVDATTASMVLQVFDALSDKNQRKMASLPIRKMVAITTKMLG